VSNSTDTLREEVRHRYAEAARSVRGGRASCCGDACCTGNDVHPGFGEALYSAEERSELPDTGALASLGCGNPTAVAELNEGEVVLDLGSGGGMDVILSAKRVGPTGVAYGLDMTDEMLALARDNAREARVANVHFLKGVIESVPLAAESVDVVIAGRARGDHGRRGRGSPHSGRARTAGQLRRLRRGCSLEERVRGRPGKRGIRARERRVHA
jgi:arsenite methyltransferase